MGFSDSRIVLYSWRFAWARILSWHECTLDVHKIDQDNSYETHLSSITGQFFRKGIKIDESWKLHAAAPWARHGAGTT